jgi:hypothetical protein
LDDLLCMNFYLKHEFFLMYFKIPYDFTILRSEFVNGFPCRVKITILTTLPHKINCQVSITRRKREKTRWLLPSVLLSRITSSASNETPHQLSGHPKERKKKTRPTHTETQKREGDREGYIYLGMDKFPSTMVHPQSLHTLF